MINPFADWLRWDHTSGSLARGRCVETRIIPGFRRPPTFTSFPVPSVPFFFLPLTLLLLLVFQKRKPHGLHHHKLRGTGQNTGEVNREKFSKVYLLKILTRNVHLAQESIEGRILSLITPSPSTARPTSLGVTTVFGQGVNSSARDSNRDEPVSDLPHNDTPIGPSLSLSSNSSQLSFPVGADLI